MQYVRGEASSLGQGGQHLLKPGSLVTVHHWVDVIYHINTCKYTKLFLWSVSLSVASKVHNPIFLEHTHRVEHHYHVPQKQSFSTLPQRLTLTGREALTIISYNTAVQAKVFSSCLENLSSSGRYMNITFLNAFKKKKGTTISGAYLQFQAPLSGLQQQLCSSPGKVEPRQLKFNKAIGKQKHVCSAKARHPQLQGSLPSTRHVHRAEGSQESQGCCFS